MKTHLTKKHASEIEARSRLVVANTDCFTVSVFTEVLVDVDAISMLRAISRQLSFFDGCWTQESNSMEPTMGSDFRTLCRVSLYSSVKKESFDSFIITNGNT